ncbi:hypothetical protein M0R45_017632 [Rubus argutus]|uniref:CCHC-type domain-containing protein n=1 Tax=Rubus argutus TaxID=59490 RepID=A0AAW1XWN0_RUBAR
MQVVDGLKRVRLEMDPRDIDNEPSPVFPAKSPAPLSFKATLIGTTLFDPTTGGLDDISRITVADCKVQELERGNLLGETVKVDLHTAAQARGKYARIYVELDLSKPLRAEVQVKDTWYKLEYECMPTYCYSCGIVGHTQNNCPELNIVDVAAHSTLLFPGNVENIMSESLQLNTCATGSVNATDVDGKSVDATSKIGLGPWNDVVYKRNRKNLKGKLNSSGKNDTQGSRFQVLADEIEETHTVNGQMETVGTGSSLGKVWKKVQDKSTGKKKQDGIESDRQPEKTTATMANSKTKTKGKTISGSPILPPILPFKLAIALIQTPEF